MTLRVGLVGCGQWGRHILRDLICLGADVHVAAHSTASRATALAQGATRAVEHADALEPGLDGYVVATPSATHAAVIESLLVSGRPIFVEKPMTIDVASAKRLAAAAPDRIFVMDKWRYHPGVEALAAMARAGDFGKILGVRTCRVGLTSVHPDSDAIWMLMPHDLSIAFEILGYLPPPRAAWTPYAGRAATDMIGVLADGRGPQVTIEIGASHPVNRRTVIVVGTRRSGQLGGSYDDRLLIADTSPDGKHDAPYERAIPNDMPLLKELRAFIDHLRGGPPPRSSAAEGMLVVERIAALRALAGLAD